MLHEQVVERGVAVLFGMPIAKSGINVEARTVRGLMTQECVDSHGEEVDFASVVEVLNTWKGNVREMHQPKAVGRALDILVRDDIKAVEVESYVSTGAEDTWLKCVDGTLGYYSIGGRGDRVVGVRSDGSRGTRIIMRAINELSLVDSGSCPTSQITVAKSVNGVVTTPLGDELNKSVELPIQTGVKPILDLVLKSAAGFRSERYDIYQAVCALQCLEELIVSESYETADGQRDNTAQVEMLKTAVYIVLDFLMSEFDQQFASDADALAKSIDALPDDIKKATARDFIEKMRAKTKTGTDAEVLQKMHDNATKLGASCGGSAVMNAVDDTTKSADVIDPAPAATQEPAPAAVPAVAADPVAAPVTEPVAKAVDPVAESTPVAAAAGVSSADVQKMVSDAVAVATGELRTQLEEQRATSTETIAKLNERVEKLAGEPAPGGPVANAHATIVEKMLNGTPADMQTSDPGVALQVITALEDIAKSTTDPNERANIVSKCIALRTMHGVDAKIVPMHTMKPQGIQ